MRALELRILALLLKAAFELLLMLDCSPAGRHTGAFADCGRGVADCASDCASDWRGGGIAEPGRNFGATAVVVVGVVVACASRLVVL